MLWGQSAGAGSVDIHNYAYYKDPIARAFFMESGNELSNGTSALSMASSVDFAQSNFTVVAKGVGCDYPNDAQKELACMQTKPVDDIINYFGRYNSTAGKLSFTIIPDEKVVFANTTARYQTGMMTRAPIIMSSVANEGGSLVQFPLDDPQRGVNQTAANQVTISILCAAARSNALRHGIGLPTYRYQYAGNWTNQDPLPWMGAFHSSDLVMLFGTYDLGDGPPTRQERITSETMQDHVLAFLKDPWNGLASVGWAPTDPTSENGGTMLRFGADGKAVQTISAGKLDAICSGKGKYNPFP
jgi:acetylcholinesterase